MPLSEDSPAGELCTICGDSAGCGMNFGCLSCESCKAFFRRCCSKLGGGGGGQKQVCPFSGQCRITKASRRACPACRLEKCIQAGMRREMVDAWKKHWTKGGKEKEDEEGDGDKPRMKRKRMKERGGGRRGHGGCVCKCTCDQNRPTGSEKGTQTEEAGEEPKCALAATASLDPTEQSLLDELVRASLILDSPLRVPQNMPFNLTLVDALRVSELAMRRMVGICKHLAAFRALDPRDQVALLRASLVELLILRGAMAFDPSNGAWRHALTLNTTGRRGGGGEGGQQQAPFCLNINVLERHSEEHRHFLATFNERWRTNRHVMLILYAIVLFSPRQNIQIVAKEAIHGLREKYCQLLKRYLLIMEQEEGGGGGDVVDQAFGHLMGKLEELHRLNASFQWLYSRVNLGELEEPLLKELLGGK